MANLHFKNCSEVFNPFILKSRSLKIGLSAYKAYVDTQLLEFTQVIKEIFDDSQPSAVDSEYSTDSLIPATLDVNGINRIVSVTLNDARSLADGSSEAIQARLCKPTSETMETTVQFTLDDLNRFITDKISCLQGQSVIYGAAIKQDLNSSFNSQSLISEMQLRGFETSDYLQSLTAGVTSGMTWVDILSMLAGNVREPEIDPDGYWYFNPDEFSNTNSIVLGVTSIVQDVASFFDSLKFDIFKIGEYFANLWKGITDLATWLLTIAVGDLLTDYLVKNDYTLEGLNIPFASVHCNINDITTNSHVNAFVEECYTNPDKMAFCHGWVSAADNAFDRTSYRVKYTPNLVQVLYQAKIDLRDGATRVIPWSNGFMLILRKGEDLSVYYFLGDFRTSNQWSSWEVSVDGEIRVKNDWILNRDYRTVEFKRNQDFRTWFASLLYDRQDGTGKTIVTDRDFLGNGIVGNVSSGYEYYLDMSINTDAIDGPGTLVDQFEQYYFEGVTSRFAAQLLCNALVYNNIFTCDQVRGAVILYDSSTDNNVHAEGEFAQTSFLPYETNQMITFKYHAQSDTERANEVIDVIKKIALAAVVAGAAIATVKITKAIKVRSYAAQVSANDAWRAANVAPADQRTAAIKAAYRAQRKANVWQRVGSLVGGKTMNSALSDTLSSFSLPSVTDSSIDLIYEVITGQSI